MPAIQDEASALLFDERADVILDEAGFNDFILVISGQPYTLWSLGLPFTRWQTGQPFH